MPRSAAWKADGPLTCGVSRLNDHSACQITICRAARSTTTLRDSIEAHPTIVFAALAVSRWIEHQTGWSIRRFVKTARRYRTIQIQALPPDLRAALDKIRGRSAAH